MYFWSFERIANFHTYMYANVSFSLLSSIIGIENKICFVKFKKNTLIIHFRTNTTLRIKVLADCFYKKYIFSFHNAQIPVQPNITLQYFNKKYTFCQESMEKCVHTLVSDTEKSVVFSNYSCYIRFSPKDCYTM